MRHAFPYYEPTFTKPGRCSTPPPKWKTPKAREILVRWFGGCAVTERRRFQGYENARIGTEVLKL